MARICPPGTSGVGCKNPNTLSVAADLEGFGPITFEELVSEALASRDVIGKAPATMSAVLAEYAAVPSVFSFGIEQDGGNYYRPPSTGGSFAWSTSSERIRAGGGKEPRAGVDPENLAQAGWGVLFADEAAREALEPLLELRREQAGELFAEYEFQPGQSAQAFLNQHLAPPGPADPERAAPYYLTVVGDAEAIPFDFQQELDVRYAVGRICFDRPEDYATYAAAVVAAERGEIARSRSALYFGVEHADDPVTRLCTKRLVEPLATSKLWPDDWHSHSVVGSAASHEELARRLESEARPALLLTAGHGLVTPNHNAAQRRLQGALLTADWPGPGAGSVRPEQLFSAEDLTASTDVAGMVAILVGCFTAGTPSFDSFVEGRQNEIAPAPFVAEFPKRLLARGALAALGHVDNLYVHTYAWPGAGHRPQHQTFESMIYGLLTGRRLGHAMDTFGRLYGELAARLLAARLDPGHVSEEEYSSYWIGYHNARQYLVLGDPAVRLAVAS